MLWGRLVPIVQAGIGGSRCGRGKRGWTAIVGLIAAVLGRIGGIRSSGDGATKRCQQILDLTSSLESVVSILGYQLSITAQAVQSLLSVAEHRYICPATIPAEDPAVPSAHLGSCPQNPSYRVHDPGCALAHHEAYPCGPRGQVDRHAGAHPARLSRHGRPDCFCALDLPVLRLVHAVQTGCFRFDPGLCRWR